MHDVKLETHYGTDLVIEQCKKCGGLWFDALEVFRAKAGSADDFGIENIDTIDLPVLYNDSILPSEKLFCPIDRQKLKPFSDRRYPEDLQVQQCSLCGGMWLNRGEFQLFEKHREAIRNRRVLDEKSKKTPEEKQKDVEFNETMRQVYEQAMEAGDDQAILQLTEFLAGPKPKILQDIALREEFEPALGVAFRSIYDGYGFAHVMKYFAASVPAIYMPLIAMILIIGMIMRRIQQEEKR